MRHLFIILFLAGIFTLPYSTFASGDCPGGTIGSGDIGLKVQENSVVQSVAVSDDSSNPSASGLKIYKATKTYSVLLVPIADPCALKTLIQTPTGIQALKRYCLGPSCVADTCLGSIPANTTECSNDSNPVNNTTPWSMVSACSGSTNPCRALCDPSQNKIEGGSCVPYCGQYTVSTPCGSQTIANALTYKEGQTATVSCLSGCTGTMSATCGASRVWGPIGGSCTTAPSSAQCTALSVSVDPTKVGTNSQGYRTIDYIIKNTASSVLSGPATVRLVISSPSYTNNCPYNNLWCKPNLNDIYIVLPDYTSPTAIISRNGGVYRPSSGFDLLYFTITIPTSLNPSGTPGDTITITSPPDSLYLSQDIIAPDFSSLTAYISCGDCSLNSGHCYPQQYGTCPAGKPPSATSFTSWVVEGGKGNYGGDTNYYLQTCSSPLDDGTQCSSANSTPLAASTTVCSKTDNSCTYPYESTPVCRFTCDFSSLYPRWDGANCVATSVLCPGQCFDTLTSACGPVTQPVNCPTLTSGSVYCSATPTYSQTRSKDPTTGNCGAWSSPVTPHFSQPCSAGTCVFYCAVGYNWNGSACVANNSCQTPPASANATLCTDGPLPTTPNQAYTIASSCSTSIACDAVCNGGYILSGGSCVLLPAACTAFSTPGNYNWSPVAGNYSVEIWGGGAGGSGSSWSGFLASGSGGGGYIKIPAFNATTVTYHMHVGAGGVGGIFGSGPLALSGETSWLSSSSSGSGGNPYISASGGLGPSKFVDGGTGGTGGQIFTHTGYTTAGSWINYNGGNGGTLPQPSPPSFPNAPCGGGGGGAGGLAGKSYPGCNPPATPGAGGGATIPGGSGGTYKNQLFNPKDIPPTSPGGGAGPGIRFGYSGNTGADGLILICPVSCIGAADCDDGNACTTDTCSAGTCVHTPISCPPGQTCVSGACVLCSICSGKVCGNDGCGGSCGTCSTGVSDTATTCNATTCSADTCTTSGQCYPTCNTGYINTTGCPAGQYRQGTCGAGQFCNETSCL